MIQHVKTVLGFVNAAQTMLALYESPDGPTDPLECCRTLSEILEDPALLIAQRELTQRAVAQRPLLSIVSAAAIGVPSRNVCLSI